MIIIKQTSQSDAERLAEIQNQAFLPLYKKYHDQKNPCLRGTEDILGRLNTPDDHYFTILDDESIIGGMFYRCHGSSMLFGPLEKGDYYLQRVYITPAFQNKGAASAAIRICENGFSDAVKFYVDFPVDLLKNRRCYEKVGYRDTGKRFEVMPGLILACFEKKVEAEEDHIRPICYDTLPEAINVIHQSFEPVAERFGLTRENYPKHTSFMPIESLQAQMQRGFYMFGLYENGKIVGYASLSDKGRSAYMLHNLAVLPEYRHNGYGRKLLDYAKEKVRALGGTIIKIDIIEENTVLKEWYLKNGFTHTGTKKFDHLPFTTGFMEWNENSHE